MDIKKQITTLAVLSALSVPFVISAQGDQVTPILCTFAKNLWMAAAAGIIICWSIVAIIFLTSVGNPERVGIAKKGVVAAIIGTIIIGFGSVAVPLVGNAIGKAVGGNVCEVGTSSPGDTQIPFQPSTTPPGEHTPLLNK